MIPVTIIITVFVLQQTSIMAQEQLCPEIYRRYSKDHSGCMERLSSCEYVKIGMDDPETEKEVIVRYHNEIRSKIATGQEKGAGGMPPAADMIEITWDDELAYIAQKWAFICYFPLHDCWSCRATRTFPVSQCLALLPHDCTKDQDCAALKYDWIHAITLFYDEIKNFRKSLIKSMVWSLTWGHFAAINWASVYKIGCGVVSYRESSTRVNQLYVCNYAPAPDTAGGRMYIEGPTCSACPINSCCGGSTCSQRSYPGLCQLYSTPPQYPTSPRQRFHCAFQSGDPNCAFTQEGDVGWELVTTIAGNMVSIVLGSSQTSSIHFQQWVWATNGSCLYVSLRKGPNVDGQMKDNLAEVILDYNGEKFPTELWSPLTWEFHKFPIVLKKDGYFQITITMKVPPGAPPQFFECQDIEVVEEPCDFHIKELGTSGSHRLKISSILRSLVQICLLCLLFY